MSLVKKEITMLVSSNPALGAKNLTTRGDRFSITLQDSLSIPKNAHNVQVKVISMEVWNVVANVGLELGNDKLSISINSIPYVLTFESGIYTLDELSTALNIQLKALAGASYNENSIQLQGDTSTSKVLIKITQPNISINFGSIASYGLADLLGFDHIDVGNGADTSFYKKGNSKALLNNVNYMLIHSDLVNNGLTLNGVYDRVIAKVNITAPPSSLIIYEPNNPYVCSEDGLSGVSKKEINFWLTDDSNRPVTMPEYYSFRMVISWEEMIILKTN